MYSRHKQTDGKMQSVKGFTPVYTEYEQQHVPEAVRHHRYSKIYFAHVRCYCRNPLSVHSLSQEYIFAEIFPAKIIYIFILILSRKKPRKIRGFYKLFQLKLKNTAAAEKTAEKRNNHTEYTEYCVHKRNYAQSIKYVFGNFKAFGLFHTAN